MKRILIALCCSLLLIATQSFAQTAASTVQLSSRLTDMENAHSRSSAQDFSSAYQLAEGIMAQHIAEVHQQYMKASGKQKEALQAKSDKLQAYYSDAKMLAIDVNGHHSALISKVKQYIADY